MRLISRAKSKKMEVDFLMALPLTIEVALLRYHELVFRKWDSRVCTLHKTSLENKAECDVFD